MHDGTNEGAHCGSNELYLWIEVTPVLALSTATKEMDDPEDTAEKVGISALIVQVNDHNLIKV